MRRRSSTPERADATAQRDAFLAAHVGLVHHVAHQLERYVSDEVTHDELVSAGALGLLSAERTFDSERGHKFSTYAVPRIRGAMLDDLRRQDLASRSTRRRARLLDGVRAHLGNALGRAPTREEIARVLGLSPETVGRWEVAVVAARRISIDEIVAREEVKNGHPVELGFAQDDRLASQVARAEDREELRRAVQRLPDCQREVLIRYYWRGEKLGAIAEALSLTESRISQIKSAAIEQLRAQLAAAA